MKTLIAFATMMMLGQALACDSIVSKLGFGGGTIVELEALDDSGLQGGNPYLIEKFGSAPGVYTMKMLGEPRYFSGDDFNAKVLFEDGKVLSKRYTILDFVPVSYLYIVAVGPHCAITMASENSRHIDGGVRILMQSTSDGFNVLGSSFVFSFNEEILQKSLKAKIIGVVK